MTLRARPPPQKLIQKPFEDHFEKNERTGE